MKKRPTNKEHANIVRIIEDYVKQYGADNTRKIAEYVASETGFRPSTATVAAILKKFGYSPAPSYWRKHE